MTPPYDVDHFIRKFEAIPEEYWAMFSFVIEKRPECKCALGHLGCSDIREEEQNAEVDALRKIIPLAAIVSINDNDNDFYTQTTPKQRVLQALRDIKDREK